MPDFNSTVALNPNAPAPVNPLQTALQVAQYRTANAQGQALQQGLAANQATSAAYQQATDPTTGIVDNNKLMALISQDPRAAYNMSAIAQGINTQRQQQATLTGTNIDNAIKAQQGLRTGLGSLLTKPDLSPQDVQAFGQTQLQSGAITPQVYQAEMQSMPQDPNQLRPWLAQHFQSALSGEQQLANMKPNYANVNTGPATVAVNQNPNAIGANGQPLGVGSVGYTVQNGLSPSDAATPVTVSQNGQPTLITKGQFAGAQGSQPVGPSTTQNGQPAQPSTPGQLPTGGFASSPPLGADKIADDASARFNGLQQAAQQAKPLMQTYDLANQAIQGAIAQGKGSSTIASAGGVVQTILGALGKQSTGDSVKDYQLATNYLNSAADQAASSLGLSGSDSRLAAAKAGQPDPNNMNLPALQESIAHAKGLQQALLDRQQATTKFLAQNGNNTSALPQFESQWNQAFDPNVSFIRSLSTPQAQQAAMQQLQNEGKLQQWTQDYQKMKALGAF